MMTTPFQPGQIVQVTCASDRLYGEVIQVSETRCLCWVRPLALWLEGLSHLHHVAEALAAPTDRVIDLRGGCDLLLPPSFLQMAGDVEFLSVLDQMNGETKASDDVSSAKDSLSKFLQRLSCTVR